MKDTVALKELLATPKRIAITTHQKPDGDAMGSSLAMFHFLKKLGHTVKVVAPTDYPDFLKWLPGNSEVVVGPDDIDMAKWTFEGADIIFCLDFNALKRLQDFEHAVMDSMATKVMIDHHMEPEDFADLVFWDDKASSAAEMVYRVIEDLGELDKLDLAMAECIYTGVMTDTGSFRFTNTSPAVHRMVAHLMELGVDVNKAYDEVFCNSSPERFRFIGYCLNNCLHVLPELNTAYIKVDREVFRKFNIRSGDTEGLVNYALNMKGIYLGVLFTVQDDLVKMSFRSRGHVSASEFAGNFDGGGHFYAAGGRSKDTLENTEKRFLELLEAKKTELVAS
ncbi:bifunctional oligoribonuclease/PAP phosphatase NrnA [Pontibacter sp. G13]|uniref:DHH family phosphoesterase n=1 Tax=Pontibacter sp. G13 TaxID=3074898 RepID=UPI00288A4E8B|nr:bifunctional oligoribonuclease/PAP phosphatase NrnA [Pontibacter sp. G13]WNJ16120.1 bifunctional oligoribonuclease/PAP phosphatase NrnA [Pontibacter sp. G13]